MKSLPISYSQLFHQELTCILGEIYIRLIYLQGVPQKVVNKKTTENYLKVIL